MLKRQDYGILYPYIMMDSVTDINWNGKQLWIDDLNRGRFMAPEVLSDAFVDRFVLLLSNVAGLPFNRVNPVLEVETEELRISVVHACVAHGGYNDFSAQDSSSEASGKGRNDSEWLL